MLLQKLKDSSLLFNSNFLEDTSESGTAAYRGELTLVEGDSVDEKGHAKPPVEVMLGVAMLADDKLKMIIGQLEQMASLPNFIDKYKDEFSSDMLALIYVVNLEKPMQVELEGINFVLIPLVQGVPWNEALDELGLEKSDFKGQSSADKVLTLYSELKDYKPKYPSASLDDAMSATNEATREGWGAV